MCFFVFLYCFSNYAAKSSARKIFSEKSFPHKKIPEENSTLLQSLPRRNFSPGYFLLAKNFFRIIPPEKFLSLSFESFVLFNFQSFCKSYREFPIPSRKIFLGIPPSLQKIPAEKYLFIFLKQILYVNNEKIA